MKNSILVKTILLSILLSLPLTSVVADDKGKAFIDSYKKAFESKDEATLTSFLYSKGADPEILEFYTMMMTGELGGKITSIEMKDLTTEDLVKANKIQPGPSGADLKLPITPSKKLILKISNSEEGGNSNSTSETFLAEVDGKYVIPVPGPVK